MKCLFTSLGRYDIIFLFPRSDIVRSGAYPIIQNAAFCLVANHEENRMAVFFLQTATIQNRTFCTVVPHIRRGARGTVHGL